MLLLPDEATSSSGVYVVVGAHHDPWDREVAWWNHYPDNPHMVRAHGSDDDDDDGGDNEEEEEEGDDCGGGGAPDPRVPAVRRRLTAGEDQGQIAQQQAQMRF